MVEATDGTGGTVTELRAGTRQARELNFSAYVEYRQPSAKNDFELDTYRPVAPLKISPDPKKKAFTFSGKDLFIEVFKEYTEPENVGEPVLDGEGKPVARPGENGEDEPVYEYHYERKVNFSKRFWIYFPEIDTASPAGEYSDDRYELNGKGEEYATPRGLFGPCYLEPTLNGTVPLTFKDQNFEPDTATTPKEDWNPFANDNFPATVCFHQQRMVLAGTKENPASFCMSRTGDYENFRKSRPLHDDDPVECMLAAGSMDDIKWVTSFGDLLIGTAGAEYKATSDGAAITSKDVQISVQSYWGSASLTPLVLGQSVLHCQRSGSHARDMYYSWESDGYSGNDLSLLAAHMVEDHRIVQWAFQQTPGSCIWG